MDFIIEDEFYKFDMEGIQVRQDPGEYVKYTFCYQRNKMIKRRIFFKKLLTGLLNWFTMVRGREMGADGQILWYRVCCWNVVSMKPYHQQYQLKEKLKLCSLLQFGWNWKVPVLSEVSQHVKDRGGSNSRV